MQSINQNSMNKKELLNLVLRIRSGFNADPAFRSMRNQIQDFDDQKIKKPLFI